MKKVCLPNRVWALAVSILLIIAALLSFSQWRQLAGIWSAIQIRHLIASDDFDMLASRLDASMVSIPAGEFILGSPDGSPDEQPSRRIYLDSFQIDRYEVTNAQYRRFLLEFRKSPPRYWSDFNFPPGQAGVPVVGVSWDQAHAYCAWQGKRLPTEAEWEKACRGVRGRIYPWGDAWDEHKANVGLDWQTSWPAQLESSWSQLQGSAGFNDQYALKPVGSYLTGMSVWGVFDLVGNASEWTADWYTWRGYHDLPSTNPIGLGPPWNHSVRGSAWFDRLGTQAFTPDLSRCAQRNSSHSFDDPRLGFRCMKSVGTK